MLIGNLLLFDEPRQVFAVKVGVVSNLAAPITLLLLILDVFSIF